MDLKISFVGGGKMAEAIVSGIVQSKLVSPSQILVSEPVEAYTVRHNLTFTTVTPNVKAWDGGFENKGPLRCEYLPIAWLCY